jgi:hypothetical protein
MPRRNDISKVLEALACAVLLMPAVGYGCQVSCVEYGFRTATAVLLSEEGQPLIRAHVLVRAASKDGTGPSAICGTKKGHVVAELTTDNLGQFELKGLREGQYWVTYLDDKDGESFLISIEGQEHVKRLKLGLNSLSGRCYLVDIERNVSKPPGATPVEREASEKR